MRFQATLAFGWAFVALLTLAGCSNNKMADVKGTVTIDKNPIQEGTITFFPEDGKAPTTGGPITKGEYNVKVPVGLMKVSISMGKVVGKKKLYPDPDSPYAEVKEEALPAKYNEQSELKLEVTPGTVQKDFDLTSK